MGINFPIRRPVSRKVNNAALCEGKRTGIGAVEFTRVKNMVAQRSSTRSRADQLAETGADGERALLL
jgi:hypothetical protein